MNPRRVRVAVAVLLSGGFSLGVTPTLSPDEGPAARSRVRRHLQRSPIAVAGPTLAGCPIFPASNVWNARVDLLPVDPKSADYIATIGPGAGLHPDFGSGTWDGGPIGIPYAVVPGSQPRVAVRFDYADESDPGPYPIPADAPIEGGPASGGDRHVLLVDTGSCVLYELYAAYPQPDGSWHAGSGAVFDLRGNALRPAGWTSADAAGLPILPGLVRYDEVAAGAIRHALRFTVAHTRNQFVWPARHQASSSGNPAYPPMGQRFRLKAGFDVSSFPAQRAGDPGGAQVLRHDRGGQRQQLVHLGRPRRALEQRRAACVEPGPRAATSKRWTSRH